MTNIFIIYGVGGYPEENWYTWLKKELETLGNQVFIPKFPTPEDQTLENWLKTFEEYEDDLNEDSIVIGHSLGVPFILNVLEKHKFKATFLVSGFVGKAGNQFDEGMKTFAQKPFNWKQIKNNCKNFHIYHADNDPYIKLEKAHELAGYLGAKITVVEDAGHFNSTAGYDTFELLLEEIKGEL